MTSEGKTTSETTGHVAELGKVFDMVTPIVDVINGGFFHLAYWYDEDDGTPITLAGQRITRKVADALGLRRGDRLLDVGCGPGGPAVLIAEETGARVTGISISSYDLTQAADRAELAGLSGQVTFQYGDYMALSFPDASFDAVMAIESLLCAPDLGHALGEFYRVLRPGGNVAVCHCTHEAEMTDEMMARFKASNMANRLPTLAGWIEAVRAAGFRVQEYTQFGPRVFDQSSRYFDAIDDRYDELLTKVDAETIARFRDGMGGFFAPGPERVGYAIIVGRKPRA